MNKNPIEFIQSHPKMFIPTTRKDKGLYLASVIAEEAIALGADSSNIARTPEFYSVSSSFDWLGAALSGATESYEKAFNSIIPFPLLGDNSHLLEVVVNAFFESVGYFVDGKLKFSKNIELLDAEDISALGKEDGALLIFGKQRNEFFPN